MKTDTLYILHFTKPYHHARHYIGSTSDFNARIASHRAGKTGKLIAAVLQAGIDFHAFVIGPGGRDDERILKRQKNAARYCPACKNSKGKQNAKQQ